MNTALHKIVIVGGGAGGIEAATRLGNYLGRKRIARTILVDQNPTHIWKPLLHEVATGALNTGEDELNYFQHAHYNGYEFEFGRMNGLDLRKKVIKLEPIYSIDLPKRCIVKERDVKYDTLIMALGAVTNNFNIDGVDQYCSFLNNPEDAEKLRRQILGQALSIVTGNSPVSKLRIGIIGAGATGVELAAEINHTICELRNYGSMLMRDQVEITIIDQADRILTGSPKSFSEYALKELKLRNINVKTNANIVKVSPEGFHLKDGSIIKAEIKIWTAGIKAPDWVKQLGLQTNKFNQILTNEYLQSIDDPNIFVLGDCSAVPWKEEKEKANKSYEYLPATAQVANQEASWILNYMTSRLNNDSQKCSPFQYKAKGQLVSLGENRAVGSLAAIVGPSRNYHVQGKMAKLLYMSLYRCHQAALFGWGRAILLWIGDKLRKVAIPQLKLH